MTLTIIMTVLCVSHAQAAELRFFGYGHWFKADQMNDYLRSENLKEMNFLPGWGGEITWQLGRFNLGFRGVSMRLHLGDGSGATSVDGDQNYGLLTAQEVGPILRWYIIDSEHFRFDVFGGGTFIRANLETKTASGTHNWQTNQYDNNRFGSFAGGSISVGWSNFFFFAEGGYDWFWLSELRRSPSASPAIEHFDMKGIFATVGVGFRGLEGKSGGGRSPASSSSSSSDSKLWKILSAIFD